MCNLFHLILVEFVSNSCSAAASHWFLDVWIGVELLLMKWKTCRKKNGSHETKPKRKHSNLAWSWGRKRSALHYTCDSYINSICCWNIHRRRRRRSIHTTPTCCLNRLDYTISRLIHVTHSSFSSQPVKPHTIGDGACERTKNLLYIKRNREFEYQFSMAPLGRRLLQPFNW